MCDPFGTDSICGWRPSLLARDLSSGSEWGSMNIHMNQAWADMQARSTLYMTPTMSWNSFCDYGMPSGGLNYLCDPRYTIGQWQWNQNNNNNCWGGVGTNGMNWGNNPWGNLGWNGGNTSGSNSSATTPEERAAQRKYNKLLGLVKQLASDDSKLPAARKEALDEIAKHPVGKTYEEKLKNLKTEYDRVSKEDIKKFLASNAARSFTVDGSTNTANSFYNKLQKVGFEFDNSAVDSEISDLYDVISQLKDKQENYQNSSILGDLAGKTGTYDILDVISSWNTQKKDSTGDDKRIITLIKKGYDALPSGETGDGARSSVKTGVISPIVNGLINRARGLKTGLDSASQTKLTEAMTKLEQAYNNTAATVDPNLSKAFDDLYILTRKAAMAQLRAEIKEAYGTIDPDLFNDTLFEAETKADLKAEGFDETAINAANIVVEASNDTGIYTQRVDETKPARDQLNAITGPDNALSKATSVSGVAGVTEAWIDNNTGKVYVLKQNASGEDEIHELDNPTVDNDGKITAGTVGAKVNANDIAAASTAAKQEKEALEVEKKAVEALKGTALKESGTQAIIDDVQTIVYEEAKVTGDRTKARQFIIKNGELYEYMGNCKIGNKVKASDIKNDYEVALKKEEQTADIAKYNLDSTTISDANKIGVKMQDCLYGYTTKDDWKKFRQELDKIDTTNVMHVIAGFNAAGVGLVVDNDRFFTQLMSEDHNKEDLEDIKTTVIKYVKEYVNAKIVELDSTKQERVKKLLSTLENSSSSAETLDDTMESLFTIFKIEDTISLTTEEKWITSAISFSVGGNNPAATSILNHFSNAIFGWFK